jgi:hypothetical protein
MSAIAGAGGSRSVDTSLHGNRAAFDDHRFVTRVLQGITRPEQVRDGRLVPACGPLSCGA